MTIVSSGRTNTKDSNLFPIIEKIETLHYSIFFVKQNMDSLARQTGSGQDYAAHGTIDNIHYAFVFDGHGTNKCIEVIRTIPHKAFVKSPHPVEVIADLLDAKHDDYYRSGSTFTFARIIDNKIEIYNCGDSRTVFYLNGELKYQTPDHTFKNPDEVLRTKQYVDFIRDEKAPFPISETHVEHVSSPVGHFRTGEAIVPSQSLGHNNMTGLAPSYYTCEFNPLVDKVRIVCGSDGFWDMLPDASTGTALQLVDLAEKRWRQQWNFQGQMTNYGGHIDDIAVAILDNFVVLPPSICIPYSLPAYTAKHVSDAMSSFPLRSVDEVSLPNRKLFFLHFQPTSDLKLFHSAKEKDVKVWYNRDDTFFWRLKLSRHSSLSLVDHELYQRWNHTEDFTSLLTHKQTALIDDYFRVFK